MWGDVAQHDRRLLGQGEHLQQQRPVPVLQHHADELGQPRLQVGAPTHG